MKMIIPFHQLYGKFYFDNKNKDLFIKFKHESKLFVIRKRSEKNKHEGYFFDEIQIFQIGSIIENFPEHLRNTEGYFENYYMSQMTQNSFENHMDKTHYVILMKSFMMKNLVLNDALIYSEKGNDGIILYFDIQDKDFSNSVQMKKWHSDDHSENNYFDLWNKNTEYPDIATIYSDEILSNIDSHHIHLNSKVAQKKNVKIAKGFNITFEYITNSIIDNNKEKKFKKNICASK